jgi:hypothetical protein
MAGYRQIIAGPDMGRAFALDNGQALLTGRGWNTATQFKDLRVSRAHSEVRAAGVATVTGIAGETGYGLCTYEPYPITEDPLRVVDHEIASGAFVIGISPRHS